MDYDIDAFDKEQFDSSYELMGDRIKDMIQIYLRDAGRYIDGIHKGIHSNDVEVVFQHAHPLKSSSAGLGLKAVKTIAADIEERAHEVRASGNNLSKETLMPLYEALNGAFERVPALLEAAMQR